MYRSIEKTIINLAKKNAAIILEGPSGYGKKELARKLFPDKKVVNFEDDYIRKLAEQSPRTFLLAFPDGLIIIEAFRAKGILDAVRYYVDLDGFSPAKYIMTSSYDSRWTEFDNEKHPFPRIIITGFSIEELIKLKKVSNNPFKLILAGQHPKSLSPKYTPNIAIEDIVSRAMNHPTKKINSSNEPLFRKFLTSCARVSGQCLSMNQMAKNTGISAPTAKTWILILEELCFANVVDCERKAPIFYLTDSGVICKLLGLNSPSDIILNPHRDSIVTSFVLGELSRVRQPKGLGLNLKASVKESTSRITFQAKWDKKYEIVICPQVEVTDDFLPTRAQGKAGTKKVLLHLGDVTYTNKGVDCISWRDWYKFACELDYFS